MRPWLVLRNVDRLRWGGDLRRRYVFDGLVERGAEPLHDHRTFPIRLAIRRHSGPRWHLWRRRTLVASTEMLFDKQLLAVAARGRAAVLDLHDDPLRQLAALGVELPPDESAAVRARFAANLAAFRDLVVPSARFADLLGLPLDRVIVGPSGTNTTIIQAEPWPSEPAVGFISGAAPRRGIEELVEAVAAVRERHPATRLLLWLAATGDASLAYLEGLRTTVGGRPWIEIGTVPYDQLSPQFGRATVLAIPTPAHEYWDSVVPMKLYDALAAGRPTLTTPRLELARFMREHEVGLVAPGDSANDLAAGLDRLLGDEALARRLGANARQLAETQFDWTVLGRRLADAILERW